MRTTSQPDTFNQNEPLLSSQPTPEYLEAMLARMLEEASQFDEADPRTRQVPRHSKKAKKDRSLAASLNLPDEKLDQLVPILDRLADADRQPRNRKEAARHRRRMGAIIASMLRAGVSGKACHYSRDHSTFRGRSIYKPDWLASSSLITEIDALIRAGLLEGTIGDQGGPNRKGKRRSTIRATPLLNGILQECGISAAHVLTSVDDHVPVIVKYTDGRPCEYDPDDAVIAEIATNVMTYSEFIASAQITYIDKEGVLRNMPSVYLQRIYNSPDLLEGGRFFNGWWENIKKELRPSIRINDRPTVELDFAGMHLRILYHVKGIDFPHDPYEIPQLKALAEEQGVCWRKVRKKIKRLSNTLLNAPDEFEGWEWDFYPLEGVSYQKVGKLIREHHSALEDVFFRGLGLACMQVESNIMEAIMMRGVESRIPVLPIHDSVRVASTLR